MNGPRQRLWLALRLRNLPLTALDATPEPEQPLAVVEQRQVVFRNSPAAALGVAPGMDGTTARLLGCQHILARQPHREEAVLAGLRDQLYRFSPHVDIQRSRCVPQAGLLLEVSTCLRLFSGLKHLANRVLGFLEGAGHEVRAGLGHTAGAAWLLSFSRHPVSGDESQALFVERLNRLPVQVLQDHPQAVSALLGMGFATLGDVARQIDTSSLASLAKRLGREFAAALADIYAIDRDFSQASLFSPPVVTHTPVEPFEASLQFDYPATQVDHLRPAFEKLLGDLGTFLRRHQLQCQHIQWRLVSIYRQQDIIDIHSDTPQGDWPLLLDLTLIALENRPMAFEVDAVTLICHDRLPLRTGSGRLDFNGEGRSRGNDREQAVTMARLKTRLGDAAVHKVGYRDSLLPELSHAVIGLAEKARQQLPDLHHYSLRPSWLFPEPHPVEERNRRLYWQGYLTLAVGPERLAGHWWENGVARDYYLARRQDNVAVWVYRDLHDRRWYVQGVFA